MCRDLRRREMMSHWRLPPMIWRGLMRLSLCLIARPLHGGNRDEQAAKEQDEDAGETRHQNVRCHLTPP
jgi:hypothetical protein